MKVALSNTQEAESPAPKRGRGPKGANGPNREAYFPQAVKDVPGMASHDWWVLSLLLRGQALPQIAADTGISHPRLVKMTQNPVFRQQLEVQTRAMIEKITTGEYGVSAIAKANAPGAMRRIVKLSKEDTEPRVALAANKDVLNYAGYQPPKRIEISLDGMVDKMDVEEKLYFATTGEWPERLLPQIERLAQRQDDEKLAKAKKVGPSGS